MKTVSRKRDKILMPEGLRASGSTTSSRFVLTENFSAVFRCQPPANLKKVFKNEYSF